MYFPDILRNWLSCLWFKMEARVLIAFSGQQYRRKDEEQSIKLFKKFLVSCYILPPLSNKATLTTGKVGKCRFSASENFIL